MGQLALPIDEHLPALRERLEDLPNLVSDLLNRLGTSDTPPPSITPEAIEVMSGYHWPGNVRELENELKRMNALGVQEITVEDLPEHIQSPESSSSSSGGGGGGGGGEDLPTFNIKELERITIEKALEASGGNKTHAAKMLGLSRRGLLKKLDRHGLRDESCEDEYQRRARDLFEVTLAAVGGMHAVNHLCFFTSSAPPLRLPILFVRSAVSNFLHRSFECRSKCHGNLTFPSRIFW